jgi:hypothetical protein
MFRGWVARGAGIALAALLASGAAAQDAMIYGKSDPGAKSGGRLTVGSLTDPPALDP